MPHDIKLNINSYIPIFNWHCYQMLFDGFFWLPHWFFCFVALGSSVRILLCQCVIVQNVLTIKTIKDKKDKHQSIKLDFCCYLYFRAVPRCGMKMSPAW